MFESSRNRHNINELQFPVTPVFIWGYTGATELLPQTHRLGACGLRGLLIGLGQKTRNISSQLMCLKHFPRKSSNRKATDIESGTEGWKSTLICEWLDLIIAKKNCVICTHWRDHCGFTAATIKLCSPPYISTPVYIIFVANTVP